MLNAFEREQIRLMALQQQKADQKPVSILKAA